VVVYSILEPLFAAEVSLCGLDRDMTQAVTLSMAARTSPSPETDIGA
jgi:hypothetical protein